MLPGAKPTEGSFAATELIVFHLTAAGQIPPQENLAMREEIVVQNHGRLWQQIRDSLFALVSEGDVLDQKFLIWFDDGFFLGRKAGVPGIRTKIAVGFDSHFGCLLGLGRAIVNFDSGGCDAHVGSLLDVESLRANALSVDEDAKASCVNDLCFRRTFGRFLLVAAARRDCGCADADCHHHNRCEEPCQLRNRHCFTSGRSTAYNNSWISPATSSTRLPVVSIRNCAAA